MERDRRQSRHQARLGEQHDSPQRHGRIVPAPRNARVMAQLERLVGRLHSSLLDRSRPLWEIHSDPLERLAAIKKRAGIAPSPSGRGLG
ncbi:MAG: wax ester/triacylglycerol synthase domain-containing protein [Variovorax sp.]